MKGIFTIKYSNCSKFIRGGVYWCSEVLHFFKPEDLIKLRSNFYVIKDGKNVLHLLYTPHGLKP